MAVCDPSGGDVGAAMTGLGYEPWCQVGVGELPAVPVSLALYSREAPPLQFLLQLEGNAGNVVEHVFAETLPDAMELLARWAPLARPVRPRPYETAGRGHTEEGHGRPAGGSVPYGAVHGRLGEKPGRPCDDDPDRPRPVVISGPPELWDRETPPEG